MSGLFITVEGIDGSGKSTQIEFLKEYFGELGFEVVFTRDPGGSKISEQIRKILLDKQNNEMSFMTEALLYAASRAQLVKQIIEPALKKGCVIICDRFIDSSLVYQGVARNIGINKIETINSLATNGLIPDLTFLLSIEPADALDRKKKQKSLDRMEKQKIYFYNQVYKGYIKIAKRYPERIKLIDATLSIETIQQKIRNEIDQIFKNCGFN